MTGVGGDPNRPRVTPVEPTAVRRATVGAALLALVQLGGCSPSPPESSGLRLLSFRQAGQQGVFLNETLVLHFDGVVDRASVTPESVRILRDDGTPARGRFETQGAKVLFLPEVPTSPDLSDGGLAPASRYAVRVAGFPHPDGVRGVRGQPLRDTRRFAFETVDPSEEGVQVLEDASPGSAEPILLASQSFGPVDPIVLTCAEPVDPSSLSAAPFGLWRFGAKKSLERIPLRIELRENRSDGARIELRPLDADGNPRLLEEGRYQLWTDPGLMTSDDGAGPLRDFRGHPILPAWLRRPLAGYFVVRSADEDRRVRGHVEDFLDPGRRSPASLAGAAGIAAWDGGRVTIRFPAAAGTGSDGFVSLALTEPRTDIHASELEVHVEERVQLTGDGLVVLRSQGRLEIAGTLDRDVGPDASGDVPDFRPGETVSSWLERMRREGKPWTVLVAGGDLVLTGELSIDGPVLLVAGGWIRDVRTRRPRPEPFRVSATEPSSGVRRAPLELDPPRLNPLIEGRTWSVLSAPIRPPSPESGVPRWLPATVTASPGAGRVRVRYLGERDRPGGAVEEVGPVDSPVLLEGCQALRLWIDLSMDSGRDAPTWDPPVLDAVEVAWEAP